MKREFFLFWEFFFILKIFYTHFRISIHKHNHAEKTTFSSTGLSSHDKNCTLELLVLYVQELLFPT